MIIVLTSALVRAPTESPFRELMTLLLLIVRGAAAGKEQCSGEVRDVLWHLCVDAHRHGLSPGGGDNAGVQGADVEAGLASSGSTDDCVHKCNVTSNF